MPDGDSPFLAIPASEWLASNDSAFVIADLSELKTNVFYELGYAEGFSKPVVVTAKKGTELPFDVKDVPTIFWDGQRGLKDSLRTKIKLIAQKQGRTIS